MYVTYEELKSILEQYRSNSTQEAVIDASTNLALQAIPAEVMLALGEEKLLTNDNYTWVRHMIGTEKNPLINHFCILHIHTNTYHLVLYGVPCRSLLNVNRVTQYHHNTI